MAQDKCKTCGAPIEIEFVSLKVSGKSFITHQIRKMIGLVIAVIRGAYPKDSIATAFNREHLDLPRAPGCGLLLESVSQLGGLVRAPAVATAFTEHCSEHVLSACTPLC